MKKVNGIEETGKGGIGKKEIFGRRGGRILFLGLLGRERVVVRVFVPGIFGVTGDAEAFGFARQMRDDGERHVHAGGDSRRGKKFSVFDPSGFFDPADGGALAPRPSKNLFVGSRPFSVEQPRFCQEGAARANAGDDAGICSHCAQGREQFLVADFSPGPLPSRDEQDIQGWGRFPRKIRDASGPLRTLHDARFFCDRGERGSVHCAEKFHRAVGIEQFEALE